MLSLVYKRVDDSTESQRLSLTLVLGNQPDPRGSVYQPARTDFECGRSLLYLAREEAGRVLQFRDVTNENRILNYLFVEMTAELFDDARQSQILSRSVLLSIGFSATARGFQDLNLWLVSPCPKPLKFFLELI